MSKRFFPILLAMIDKKAPLAIAFTALCTQKTRILDFLPPLLMRFYLAPVLWMAGEQKFSNFTATAEWFGNTEMGLGLPVPYILVFLVGLFEILGALFLFFGFATRLICLPLLLIMLVAGYVAHSQNGWLAIATGNGIFATERTIGAIERLEKANEILQAQGDFDWLTEKGSFVILNNGIEFAATYFILLLCLFFYGGGRFVSADYWLIRHYRKE